MRGSGENRRQIYICYRSPRRGEMLGVKPTEGRFAELEQEKSGAKFNSFDVSGMFLADTTLKLLL